MIDLNYIGINNPTAQESYYFYFEAYNFTRIVFENFSFKTTDGRLFDWGAIIGFGDYRVFSDGNMIRFDVQTPYTEIYNDLEFATVELTETKLIINGTEYQCTPRDMPKWAHMYLFNSFYNTNQVKEGTIGTVSYYFNNTLVEKFVPCIDDNNLLCFRHEYYEGGVFEREEYVYPNNQTYFYSGSVASTIIVDSDIKAVPASGGTINVTITTDTPWSATSTGSWYTMSQTAGTENDTAITITVPSTTSTTQSEDKITFTNENGDTAKLTIKQRKYSVGGIRLLNIGDTELDTLMIGDQEVELTYMGEEIVYQKGDGSGISMKGKAKVGTKSGSTYNLKITSSEPWTLSVDTAVTWLNFSQLTGDTGETIVTITATEDNQTGDYRATTITATTTNYSATCEVTQIAVIYVDYIHETTLTSETKHFIDTLVMHTTGTSFRVKGVVKYSNGNVIVGYLTDDSSDYRLFWAGRNPYYDINNTRLGPYSNMAENTKVDFYCYNYGFSLNGNTLGTGQTQTSITAPETIKVDIGSWWLNSLEIWDGETKVFDGHAAVEDNVIGLYDSITESMFTTSAYTLTYENVLQYECWVYDNDNSTSYLVTKENCPVYGFTHNSPIRFFISNFGGRDEIAIAKLHHPSEARNLFRYLYVYTDGRIGFGTPNDITVINVGNGAVIGEYSVTNTSNYVEITGGYVSRITIKDLY